jgi:hypothetical protein
MIGGYLEGSYEEIALSLQKNYSFYCELSGFYALLVIFAVTS